MVQCGLLEGVGMNAAVWARAANAGVCAIWTFLPGLKRDRVARKRVARVTSFPAHAQAARAKKDDNTPETMELPARLSRAMILFTLFGVSWLLAGCTAPPRVLLPDEQHAIDRKDVEYPGGYELRRFATGLTAPTCEAFDADGSLLIAQGERGDEPQIWRFPRSGAALPL